MYLIGGVFAPTIAFACEGAGAETQNIKMIPILWSGEGVCPEKEGEVRFIATGTWCEFEVKNENKNEKVTVLAKAFKYPGGEPGCEELKVVCVGYKEEARATECKPNVPLAPKGGNCFVRIEYKKQPKIVVKVKAGVTTESELGAEATGASKLLIEYPKVKIEPIVVEFKKVKLNTTVKATLTYENKGPGGWTPTKFEFKKLAGELGAWGVELGKIPCNKEVPEEKKCEEVVKFTPKNPERIAAEIATEPASELATVEGEGVA